MHQKDAFMSMRRICMVHFESDKKVLLCDINDVTIPHALCIEKKHCVLRNQFQRGVILIQKTTVW